MAPLVQQLLMSCLFLLWPVAGEFPAGPGWEWVPSITEMGGQEFAEVAQPLVKMNHNGHDYPDITPVDGWALSASVEPLWQVEGDGPLALVYEEVEAQYPRAVIAFRGHKSGDEIDSCANEVLQNNPEDMNTTLLAWCYATYNASTFDYLSQAVAYTMSVLESYPPSSVLLSGTSLGGLLVDLVAPGVFTQYSIALPVLAFMNIGRRRTMLRLGLSMEGHYTSIVGAANMWDPNVILDWDYRIGTMCLFPSEEPDVCTACFAGTPSNSSLLAASRDLRVQLAGRAASLAVSDACNECSALTHDSLLLVQLMLDGSNPTCYVMEDTLLQLPLAASDKK